MTEDDSEEIRIAREEKAPQAILFDGREMWHSVTLTVQ